MRHPHQELRGSAVVMSSFSWSLLHATPKTPADATLHSYSHPHRTPLGFAGQWLARRTSPYLSACHALPRHRTGRRLCLTRCPGHHDRHHLRGPILPDLQLALATLQLVHLPVRKLGSLLRLNLPARTNLTDPAHFLCKRSPRPGSCHSRVTKRSKIRPNNNPSELGNRRAHVSCNSLRFNPHRKRRSPRSTPERPAHTFPPLRQHRWCFHSCPARSACCSPRPPWRSRRRLRLHPLLPHYLQSDRECGYR